MNSSASGMISVDTPTPLATSLTKYTSDSCSCSALSSGRASRVPHTELERPSPPTTMEVSNSNNSNKNWLTKVCSKLRGGGKGRMEKCEKCGQRSDTCLPNASFVSGKKHFLCGDCRLTSRNMKTMYHQLCRNLSLREHASRTTVTTTTTTEDLSSFSSSFSSLSASSSPAHSPASLARSKSLKVRPTSPAESGYETATSLDSSSSSDRVLADGALSTSCGDCGRCCNPSARPAGDGDQSQASPAKDEGGECHRPAVFGGAFKSERVHLHRLQQFMVEEWVQSQSPAAAAERPQPRQHNETSPKPAAKDTAAVKTAGTKQYDGYLEIRTPNSQSVKYVFKRPEGDGQCTVETSQKDFQQQQQQQDGVKQCYRCHRTMDVAFRAPFGHGWLCEDCMDDLM